MSEQAHATTGTYLRIAAVLVMITLIEVGIFYVPAFQSVLVPVLLVLSAVKFALVVMFYMHLKFDNRFFAFLFGGPLHRRSRDRKSTRLNSSHLVISYAVFCLKKKKKYHTRVRRGTRPACAALLIP